MDNTVWLLLALNSDGSFGCQAAFKSAVGCEVHCIWTSSSTMPRWRQLARQSTPGCLSRTCRKACSQACELRPTQHLNLSLTLCPRFAHAVARSFGVFKLPIDAHSTAPPPLLARRLHSPAHNNDCHALDSNSIQTCIFQYLASLLFEVGSWPQRKAANCKVSRGCLSSLATAAHKQPVLAAHDSQPTGSPAKSDPS